MEEEFLKKFKLEQQIEEILQGKVMPLCVKEKRERGIHQSYSFRIFKGIMDYVFGTVYINQENLKSQTNPLQTDYTSDGFYKPGLTQILKINKGYPKK